ncbi:MAG: ASKHA domain-containing protein [Opitutaceae bacterium]|nr:ASKHA domain-containing protein [Opitutaceae bacterium]
MKEAEIIVRWPDGAPERRLPAGRVRSDSLATRFMQAGRPLNTRCGQRGNCAGCTVELLAGTFQQRDGAVISARAEIKACQGNVPPGTQALLAAPARSLAVHRPQVVTTFKLGVTAAQQPLVPVTPGVCDHGLAIDVGTTTVVVALVDLLTGRIVREESAFNRQIELGDDVLTRIQLAGLAQQREALRHSIVDETLTPLIWQACAFAGIPFERIAGAVVAGNTTMLHLLTGTDPTAMGVAPFRASFIHHRVMTAGELQLGVLPAGAPVHLLPGISAYVGADLVAGCACTGLLNATGPSLLVDIGTNGEILLWHGGRLLVTATAAGPAFEGGRLSRGTRAVAGAVAHVEFGRHGFPPRLRTIPGSNIVGLCGSAYVDFLAQARSSGLLAASGRWDLAIWRVLPAAHRCEGADGRGVRLAPASDATIITERDVAELLQAKAAIAAGIQTLLRRAGLTPPDVQRLYLAGGFGLHLDVSHAIACGLLPGFTAAQIEVVGNTSLGGAWLALVDRSVVAEMANLGATAAIVELNREPGFEDTFIDRMMLP